MGNIRVLPEHLANKIAAGEVVERPASIIKELVENSLDAEATSIEISIQHGGKSLIRVADNGLGMGASDAELAFQRHATSKITSAEDLEAIQSYGFRGEALPSIAAVSRVKLLTRLRGQEIGTEIEIEGGKLQAAKQSPCAEGTIVEVRDLFFNTPARRKFMKTDSTEMGHVMDMVINLALASPQIQIRFKSNDKKVLDLAPTNSILKRASDIFGEDQSKHFFEIAGEGTGVRVQGVLGKPAIARANRSGQLFFVNQRWIKSVSLSYAVMEGYHGLLMHGQFPFAIVFLDIDPTRVDVNVHPTKQEVRISNEGEIKSLIRRTIAEQLTKQGDLSPQLKSPQPFYQTSPSYSGSSALDFLNKVSGREEILKVAESSPTQHWPSSSFEVILEEPIAIKDQLHITKVLGQIHHTFIVAETEEGFIIVDQHAAHERIMFEGLLKNLESGHAASQGLLMDEILNLEPKQLEILESVLPTLRKLGFDIEPFGDRACVIRAYPAILKEEDPLACLKAFLEQKEDGKTLTDLDKQKEEVAALIACKRKSVKAHDPMTSQAMQSLLRQLSQCDNPFNCPHGRPSFFKYTFLDLEKQFKRK